MRHPGGSAEISEVSSSAYLPNFHSATGTRVHPRPRRTICPFSSPYIASQLLLRFPIASARDISKNGDQSAGVRTSLRPIAKPHILTFLVA